MSLRYQQNYIQNPHIFGSLNSYPNNPNFHQKNKNVPNSLNNNFMMNEKPHVQTYQNQNLNKSINQLPNNSKVSFARDFKHRLFQADQLQQVKKQIQKQSYRNELQQQMKADKQRKQRQKDKIQKQELERQRKFYAQVNQIKAQQPKLKQQPSYMILRSRKGGRKKQNHDKLSSSLDQSRISNTKNSNISPILEIPEVYMPKIIKRGGYHNQSTMDHIQYTQSSTLKQINSQTVLNPQLSRSIQKNKLIRQSQIEQRQLQIVRQRNYEQERISNIIKMQQKMIKKLYFFKQQILKSNNHFNMDREVQQIRNILKSKPIKLEVWSVKNDQIFDNNNDFYHFPKLGQKSISRSRNRENRSRINEGIDLNSHQQQIHRTLTAQNQQNQRKNSESQKSRKRKHEIKLFQPSNDKNYQQITQQNQNQQNKEINIPILLRNKKSLSNHQQNSQQFQ